MVYITKDNPAESPLPYDSDLKKTILILKKAMARDNDDAVCFFAGDVGTGKSTLLQHVLAIYTGNEKYDGKSTAFTLEEYAERLEEVSEEANAKLQQGVKPIGSFISGDEFDYRSIENQSKRNKGLDGIFGTIRLYQIFQGLCWPQLEKLPQSFVKDRVKLIFILNSKTSTRTYILYSKESIRRMISDGVEKLDVTTLTRKGVVKKYASLIGWFKPNDNINDPQYIKKKSEAILTRVKEWNAAMKGEEPQSNISSTLKATAPIREQGMNLNQAHSYIGYGSKKDIEKTVLTLVKEGVLDHSEIYCNHKYNLTKSVLDLVLKRLDGGRFSPNGGIVN